MLRSMFLLKTVVKLTSNSTLIKPLWSLNLARDILTKRLLHVTAVVNMRKLKQFKEGELNVVEAEKIPSSTSNKLIEPPEEARKSEACPICRLGMKRLLYTDVLILSQFLDKNHRLMCIEDTQLCLKSYFQVKLLVDQAQRCKLLPRPSDYQVYGLWDRLNTYHEWPPRKRDDPMRVIQKKFWKTTG